MIVLILIVVASLIGLIILHELGHFLTAKKLGVKVEEFGIGYPPKLFGIKLGETLYSLNLLPFGAFVRIQGEEGKVEGERSFSERPIWQRTLIIIGGVVTFWVVSFLIFSLIAGVWGLPQAVSDEFQGPSYVQIVQVAKNSPADIAGIIPGDIILEMDKVGDVQSFIGDNRGKEVVLKIKRGDEVLNPALIPRISPPPDEGAVGVALTRVAKIKYPWYSSIIKGAEVTVEKTIQIPYVLGVLLGRVVKGEKVEGVELVGPIGIGSLMGRALQSGVDNFLMFLALISLWLALVNILPIPALDGGKLLFLIIEAVRKRPVSNEIEQKITTAFFLALITLMAFVTVKDIINLF